MSWQNKAKQIISDLSLAAWRQANVKPDGTRRKRHVPYSVPAMAQALVLCLNQNNERQAKALFHVHSVLPELGS